jgi:hypothetical protein
MTKMLIDRAVVEQALRVAEAAWYPLALIAALKAALAEPVQEPVGTAGDLFTNTALERLDLRPSTKVYTTPPQRKPLTEDKMLDLISASGGNGLRIPLASAITLIRDTERAHGIKEGT